jgi:hypothetical protein
MYPTTLIFSGDHTPKGTISASAQEQGYLHYRGEVEHGTEADTKNISQQTSSATGQGHSPQERIGWKTTDLDIFILLQD